MKKLFSTVLAVTMLLALFVPQTMAEEATESAVTIAASGTSVVEVENFATSEPDSWNHTKKDAIFSGGETFLHTWKNIGTETGYTISMPITVEENGCYYTEYAVTKKGEISNVTIAVDGTEIGTNATAGTLVYTWDQYFELHKYTGNKVYLTAGEHTVTITAAKSGTETNSAGVTSNLVKFAADYVSFTRMCTPVAAEGTTTVEIDPTTVEEDITANYVEKTLATNQKMFFNDWMGTNGAKTHTLTIPITVAKDGVFQTEYSVLKGDNASTMTVFIDGKEIGDNNKSKAGTSVGYADNGSTKYFSLMVYSGDNIYLTAGVHTITIVSGIAPSNGVFKLGADYISFTKLTPTPVSSEGSTRLEIEDYITNAADISDKFSAASEGKLYFNNWKKINKSDSYTIAFPIALAEAGRFTTAYAVTEGTSSVSAATISVDGKLIGTNKAPYLGEKICNLDDYHFLTACAGNTVYLSAGEHIVTIVVEKNGTDTNNTEDTADDENLVKFGADYLSFTKEAPTEISADGTTIDWEDYDATYKASYETANNGAFLGDEWGTTAPYQVGVPVSFTEDGYYDMEYVVSNHAGSSMVSDVTISLGEEVLATNEAVSTGEFLYTYKEVLDVTKYTKKVFIPAGEYMLNLDISATGTIDTYTQKPVVKFVADYVKFTRNMTDTVRKNANGVTVIGNYETPVTGMAVAALYENDELVEVKTADVENVYTAKVDVSTDKTYDTVKLFIWSNFSTVTPLAISKTITHTENTPTTVHLFGDSLCVAYDSTQSLQGWGYYLPGLLTEEVTIDNHALGGRTAEVAYHEIWTNAKEQVKPGDYVFLAFGLNDYYNVPKYDATYKDVDTNEAKVAVYKKYLGLLRDEAEQKGATVIFTTITPEIPATDALTHQITLTTWSNYIKEVADSKNVCLDINAALRTAYFYDAEQGKETEEKAQEAYATYFVDGDRTHVKADGAKLIADTIVAELSKTDCPLKAYIK